MCGIFGMIATRGTLPLAACYRATHALRHRGPDGMGIAAGRIAEQHLAFRLNPALDELVSGPPCDVLFGHQRLAIIDLAPEAYQPMTNEDRSVWVVLNGEIYNHVELRHQLVAKGHRFTTDHSDTEVLVHGYEEWGEGLVDRLRGMFAIAVVDLRARTLFLARDPFGEKPLYVAMTGASIAFASELKALLELETIERRIDRAALADYLRFGYVPAPRTIYRGVQKLRAAERVTIDLAAPAFEPRSYWSLSYAQAPAPSEAAFREELEQTIAEAVQLRLLSDVPIGAYLSGGLDSTMVVRTIVQQLGLGAKTFNIAFAKGAHDESAYARRVADRYKTDHRVKTVEPADLLDLIPRLSVIFDEPFADSSALPSLALARMTRAEVTVALSGDGGDELLGGYTRYAWNLQLARAFDHAPGRLLSALLGPVRRFWPESVRGRGLVQLLHGDPRERYEAMLGETWLLDRSSLAATPGMLDLAAIWDERAPLLNRMCKLDATLYIPEDLATKIDRTAMSVGLEVRAPLLDRPLFELIARTPQSFFFSGGEGKQPFRRTLAAELGQDFVDRPKQGFAPPIGGWFRDQLKPLLRDTIESPSSFVAQLFPRGFASELVASHARGSRDQSHRLWSLLSLDRWHAQYGGTL